MVWEVSQRSCRWKWPQGGIRPASPRARGGTDQQPGNESTHAVVPAARLGRARSGRRHEAAVVRQWLRLGSMGDICRAGRPGCRRSSVVEQLIRNQ